jgi:hypothetical protein
MGVGRRPPHPAAHDLSERLLVPSSKVPSHEDIGVQGRLVMEAVETPPGELTNEGGHVANVEKLGHFHGGEPLRVHNSERSSVGHPPHHIGVGIIIQQFHELFHEGTLGFRSKVQRSAFGSIAAVTYSHRGSQRRRGGSRSAQMRIQLGFPSMIVEDGSGRIYQRHELILAGAV